MVSYSKNPTAAQLLVVVLLLATTMTTRSASLLRAHRSLQLTPPPSGSYWSVYNISLGMAADICNVAVGRPVSVQCCEGASEVIIPHSVIAEGGTTCFEVGPGEIIFSGCVRDGIAGYGEQCDGGTMGTPPYVASNALECGCTLPIRGSGCFKVGDFPGEQNFVYLDGEIACAGAGDDAGGAGTTPTDDDMTSSTSNTPPPMEQQVDDDSIPTATNMTMPMGQQVDDGSIPATNMTMPMGQQGDDDSIPATNMTMPMEQRDDDDSINNSNMTSFVEPPTEPNFTTDTNWTIFTVNDTATDAPVAAPVSRANQTTVTPVKNQTVIAPGSGGTSAAAVGGSLFSELAGAMMAVTSVICATLLY